MKISQLIWEMIIFNKRLCIERERYSFSAEALFSSLVVRVHASACAKCKSKVQIEVTQVIPLRLRCITLQ